MMDNEQKVMYKEKIIFSLKCLAKEMQDIHEVEKVKKIIEQLEKIDVRWYD